MKRTNIFLALALALLFSGCKDSNDVTSNNSTTNSGSTEISDETVSNSGDFLENWDAYTNGEMKVINIVWTALPSPPMAPM